MADPASGAGPKSGSVKRNRSPPYPPFVKDYMPYTGRQLQLLSRQLSATSHKDHWDMYYRNNTTNGYKDRHYILREFTELHRALNELRKESSRPTSSDAEDPPEELPRHTSVNVMEVGCGVGNAVVPLLEQYATCQTLHVFGFDISPVAIELLRAKVRERPELLRGRLFVQVLDPTKEDIVIPCSAEELPQRSDATDATVSGVTAPTPLPESTVMDFAMIIFVLSAIPSCHYDDVVRRVRACLAPGAVVFVRDYCKDDVAEKRFCERRRMDNSTFARTNGTLSHFFTVEEMQSIFQRNGFRVLEAAVVERTVENRGEELTLHRRFIQARFEAV